MNDNTHECSDAVKKEIAENVREACIKAARQGFQEALISGLCTDGAAEAAISAMQKLDIEDLIDDASRQL